MSATFKMSYNSGQDNVARPFTPQLNGDDTQRIATAAEYIATALARIDHNFDILVKRSKADR